MGEEIAALSPSRRACGNPLRAMARKPRVDRVCQESGWQPLL